MMLLVEKELLTYPEDLRSSSLLWGSCCSIFNILCISFSLVVHFDLLFLSLSCLSFCVTIGYPFGICRLFFFPPETAMNMLAMKLNKSGVNEKQLFKYWHTPFTVALEECTISGKFHCLWTTTTKDLSEQTQKWQG